MAGITTPFTTPTFPFLQTVSQRALDTIYAGVRAAERAERRADRADADGRPRPGRVRGRRHARLRLRAAVERVGAAGADDEHDVRGGVRRIEHHARRHPGHQPQSAVRRVSSRSGAPLLTARAESVLRHHPAVVVARRSDDPAWRSCSSRIPQYTTVSLYRNNVGTTRYHGLELEPPAAARARAARTRSPTRARS